MRRQRAVFLDRDGVINVRLPGGAYVTNWKEFTFCAAVPEALRMLLRAGFLLIVVTNQRGIGRGRMSEDDLEEIHRRMEEELRKEGVVLTAVLHCPHDLDDLCRCRKPKPGMLEDALKRFPIDRDGSLIIGDSKTDLEAGRNAGVDGILIVPEGGQPSDGYRTAPSLLAAARMITGAGE